MIKHRIGDISGQKEAKMLDARGLSCPEPVIMIKQAMESKENKYEIMVDNRTSVENITRFGEHQGFKVSVSENGGDYTLTLTK